VSHALDGTEDEVPKQFRQLHERLIELVGPLAKSSAAKAEVKHASPYYAQLGAAQPRLAFVSCPDLATWGRRVATEFRLSPCVRATSLAVVAG
jgi:hypothetical protein